MDADWYEDPLGRFDGRYFDGTSWTAQVSANGVLEIDADFPQPAVPGLAPTSEAAPVGNDELPTDEAKPSFTTDDRPAVEPIEVWTPRRASLQAESPARVVAVLEPHELPAAAEPEAERNWWPVLLVALVCAAIVGSLFALASRDSSPASEANAGQQPQSSDLDEEQEQRVEDLEQSGLGDSDTDDATALEELDVDLPDQLVDSSGTFPPSELVRVGSLQIVNGVSMLEDLADWHEGFAEERDLDLDGSAGCWFGELGGAAVQVAHCGPVGGSADSDFLFDLVPLAFEDVERGQVAQPIVDAVRIDALIANTLELVGAPDGPPPPQ
jgi:hypothetical protein